MVRLVTRKTTPHRAYSSQNRKSTIMSKLSARKQQLKIHSKATKTKKASKKVQKKASQAVPSFIGGFKKSMMPMLSELNRLEMQLKKMTKSAKSNKWILKTESTVQHRFQTLCNQMMKFKKTWFAKFNTFNRHASKQTQQAVRQLKTEIETLRKAAKRNQTILNRYTKTRAKKTGWKAHSTLSTLQMRSFEQKFNSIQSHATKQRLKMEQTIKQMKAKVSK